MGKELLTSKEEKFIEYQKKWNKKFEVLFTMLIIFSILVPFVLMMRLRVPNIGRLFEEGKYYSFFVLFGWLVTFLNERWSRIVNKLMR